MEKPKVFLTRCIAEPALQQLRGAHGGPPHGLSEARGVDHRHRASRHGVDACLAQRRRRGAAPVRRAERAVGLQFAARPAAVRRQLADGKIEFTMRRWPVLD